MGMMNKKQFDKLMEIHEKAIVAAKEFNKINSELIEAGYDTSEISRALIDLAKAFRINLNDIIWDQKQGEK